MSYDVYIERADDNTVGGRQRLAQAMARRYGIPEPSVIERLSVGALRVKKAVDQTAAQQLAHELRVLGAVVKIVAAGTAPPGGHQTLRPQGAPPMPGNAPAHPGARNPAAAPGPGARPPGAAPAAGPQRGAVTTDSGAFDLGALANFDGSVTGLALSSLDGADDKKAKPTGGSGGADRAMGEDAFMPPSTGAAAEVADISPIMPPPKPAPNSQTFAPPSLAAEAALELNSPLPNAPTNRPTATLAAPNRSAAWEVPTPGDDREEQGHGRPLSRFFTPSVPLPRAIAGVVIALALSYLPAHLYAAQASKSRYGQVADGMEKDIERIAGDSDRWDELSHEVLPDSMKRIEAAQANIRMTTMIIWLLGYALACLAWFRLLA